MSSLSHLHACTSTEIDLDAEGGEGDGSIPRATLPSAARTMIELKTIEKIRNE